MQGSAVVFLFTLGCVAASRQHAPAPAPAPKPAGPTLEAIGITFAIENYNYEDLDDALDAPPTASSLAHHSGEAGAGKLAAAGMSNTEEGLARYAKSIGDQIAGSSSHTLVDSGSITVKAHKHHKKAHFRANKKLKASIDDIHGGAKAHKHTAEAGDFLQLGLEPLVRDVLRDTVRDTVDELVEKFLPAESAAAGPAPAAAFLVSAAGPGPAPAPAPAHVVDVFVQFHPGKARPIADQRSSNGKEILVEVTITGKPGTGIDELPSVEAALNKSKNTGDMELWIAGALYEATGIVPEVENLKVAKSKIPQWLEGEGCEGHMKKVVERFTMAYTRRMVPAAIYNECTNYVPLMSFSHDTLPNGVDKKKCREATEEFAERWNFGKDATGKKVKADFGKFCLDICEGKYGAGAQQCHVSKGDQLALKQP